MKNVALKTSLVTAAWLAAASIASAHNQNGALGTAAGATDYYQVTCSDDGNGPAAYLAFEITDLAPKAAPIVSGQVAAIVGRVGVAANTTDAVDGNAASSPTINVQGGNGVYYVTIDKTKAGAELYSFDYHCMTSSGVHTGTSIYTLQSQ